MMVSSLSDPSQKTVLAQLQALLGVCQSRLAGKSPADSNWDWQLQESGIFEEDHHQSADGSTQTDECNFQETDSKAVQAVAKVQDFATQADAPATTGKEYQDQAVQSISPAVDDPKPEMATCSCQTDEQMMTLTEFRDVESYYVQQVEMLQKEKASHRKKFQASRDETAKSAQQLELLGRQFQERERQFEEILQKNCRAFERELEAARNLNKTELATLKECLQLVWHEVKDYSSVADMPKTSVMEFTQALISSLHGICSELGQLRIRVCDLSEMEQAFQTTLRQADGLVHHIEEKHLQRIRELEQTEQELRNRLERSQVVRLQDSDADGSLEIKIQGILAWDFAYVTSLMIDFLLFFQNWSRKTMLCLCKWASAKNCKIIASSCTGVWKSMSNAKGISTTPSKRRNAGSPPGGSFHWLRNNNIPLMFINK